MKRLMLGLLLAALLVGCSPQLIINKDGSVVAKGYHSVIHRANGATSYIAKPWWSVGFTDSIAKLVGDLVKAVSTTISPSPSPSPSPTPIPAPIPPTPVPTPTPPVPTPAPVPADTTIMVADLNVIPSMMTAAGFPGSPNAQYYVLAHVAAFGAGYSIPIHPELTVLATQRPAIEVWWWGYVDGVKQRLRANPGLKAVVIANDGRDRCGFRLGPPVYERLKEFGDRVQMGTIVPEKDY